MLQAIKQTAEWIKQHTASRPKTAIILGTGLGRLAAEIEIIDEFPYADIPNFPVSTVEGHSGRLLFGRLGGKEVMALEGRFHYYEGYNMKQVTFPVRVMYELGIKNLFVSNASGGVNPEFEIGDLMLITDHINFLPEHPLHGPNFPTGPRFPDMHEAYDKAFLQQARDIAKEKGIKVVEGVYLATQGPTYETPAEYRMYRTFGADAVGMSTVPDAMVCCYLGMKVLAVSCITNMAAGILDQPLNHAEVTETANRVKGQFRALLDAVVEKM